MCICNRSKIYDKISDTNMNSIKYTKFILLVSGWTINCKTDHKIECKELILLPRLTLDLNNV